jgi:O-methyltransferase involved in polyketide biosynthesis
MHKIFKIKKLKQLFEDSSASVLINSDKTFARLAQDNRARRRRSDPERHRLPDRGAARHHAIDTRRQIEIPDAK